MAELRWTAEQAEAITETRHALLVANAGTGKTATVVGKIRWLLGLAVEPARRRAPAAPGASGGDHGQSAPETAIAPTRELPPCTDPCTLREIAAITFTEKAAYDLKRKLREAIEGSERADELRWQIDRASIGTIHSFCGELLREHALRLGIDPTFRVLDERESWRAQDDLIVDVIKDALAAGDEGAGLLLQRFKLTGFAYQGGVVDYVREAMRDLRRYEDRYAGWTGADGGLDGESLKRLAGDWEEEADALSLRHADALVRLAREALDRWRRYLLQENVRDFDALILDARRLLTGDSAAAALQGIRRRYRILIIDEFQDTDGAQRDIAFAIAGLLPTAVDPGPAPVDRPQLFLVGDPKQSIYRFRGADIAVWNQVETALGQHGVMRRLSENFRCAPPIVDFVNAACARAMAAVAEEVVEQGLPSAVPYALLEAAQPASPTAGLEWLVAEKRKETKSGDVSVKDDVEAEAAQVAARIREMCGSEEICDPDDGSARPVRYRDMAILYRSRSVLGQFEAALARDDIPYYVAGAPHLGDRQEILDLLNLLRLLRNPLDDYRAFGFLRSPFVALRDEVIVAIALRGRGRTLLDRAERFVRAGEEWFDGPEGAAVSDIERAALIRGLEVFRQARRLVHRLPLDEVLAFALDELGYRLHLLVRGNAEEPLANVQSFLQFTEAYRDLDISTFLEVWDRWDAQDNGLPQAPLYSKDDDVVTLTTIHRSKGLEWPVVFLVGTGARRGDLKSNAFWSDPDLGPLLCPSRDDRGERAWKLWRRDDVADRAEDTRLVYVATTRARDRLVIVGPRWRERSYSEWLAAGVEGLQFAIRDAPPELPPPTRGPRPTLAWLGDLRLGERPPLLAAAPEPPARFVVSATELMTKAKDERLWRLRYRHGVQPSWEFVRRAPEGVLEPPPGEDPAASAAAQDDAPVPATVRGTVIHGVLERIRDEAELSRLLHETIGSLEDPDLEEALADTRYREALEEEIRRVVRSPEWRWYVEGDHHRELEFVHFADEREWRVGAFDLYRALPEPWVIDFKTHDIDASEVARVSRDYVIQARVYAHAAALRGPARIGLHFTGPNELVEMEPPTENGPAVDT